MDRFTLPTAAPAPQRRPWWLAGVAVLVLGGLGLALATSTPPSVRLAPLPTAADVHGDLERNWGATPTALRPLLLLAEQSSGIAGAARILAVVARGESRFVATAHNEKARSQEAWDNNKGTNPPLRYGAAAAAFGSGGLFGAMAPYFLWTGVRELGDQAPLLRAPPQLVFEPRAATFGAICYLQRILQYPMIDVVDVKPGWRRHSLLTSGRGSPEYLEVRGRFLADAQALGVDLFDAATIPPLLDASAWPGVPTVFTALVGTLPKGYA